MNQNFFFFNMYRIVMFGDIRFLVSTILENEKINTN